MSQRPARSTRAAAPVYAEHAAQVARASSKHIAAAAAAAEDDEQSDEDAPEGAAASAASVRLAHAEPLALSYAELVSHTRTLLSWREEDDADVDMGAADDAQPGRQQLDTTCLASMLSSLPASTVRALYALELSEEHCAEQGGRDIDSALQMSTAEEEMQQLVRTVRTWNEHAAAKAAQGLAAQISAAASEEAAPQSDSGEDLWTLLHAARIPPRNVVTFCFLLCAAPTGVRRSTQLLAGALYVALLEHSARTHCALSSIMQEMVLRRVQTNVRQWARQDARRKEAGIQKRKARGSKGTPASASADPFADEADEFGSSGGGSAAREEEKAQSAWMASPTAAAYIADWLWVTSRLVSAPVKNARADPSAAVLPLAKQGELASHLVETLLDITRTDVEVSKRGARTSAADIDMQATSSSASSPLPAQAFDLLLQLIQPAHGLPLHSVQLLLKHLLASALLSFGASGSSAGPATSLPRHLLRVHRSAIAFVRRLAAHAAHVVSSADLQRCLHHFLQHLLLRASDRADYRKLVTTAVVRDLLGSNAAEHVAFPQGLFSGLRAAHVSFVARMARNKRPAVRLMALELAEAAMAQSWSMDCIEPGVGLLLAASDAPKSKGAARLSFADKLQEAEGEDEEKQSSSAPANKARLSAGGLDLSVMDEDDAALAPAAADSAPLAQQLLALLLARCSDSSPTVRAKALASLAHVLAHCAEHYTSRDDPEGAVITNEVREVRARFAAMMAQRLNGSLATTVAPNGATLLQRSRSAPATQPGTAHGTPSRAQAQHFSFMHTPLQATLNSTAHTAAGDLSFNGSFLSSAPVPVLPAFHPAQAGVRDLLSVLYRRSGDEKALVRRAALQALECILLAAAAEDRFDEAEQQQGDAKMMEDVSSAAPTVPSPPSLLSCLTASDLQIFYDACFDKSLSIRKQSSASLSSLLLRYARGSWPRDPQARAALANLQRVWLGAVLPLVQDRERSVADKCVEAVRDLLVLPAGAWLQAAHKKGSSACTAPADATVWHMFGAMDGEMMHYFQLVFLQLLRGGSVASELVRALTKEVLASCVTTAAPEGEESITAESLVAAHRARACWVMLDCTALSSGCSASPAVDLTPTIRTAWERVTVQGVRLEEKSLLRLLSCVGHIAAAGAWKVQDLVSQAGYLVSALSAQVHLPVRAQSANKDATHQGPASAELVKKQVWILNSTCAALSKLQSEASSEKIQLPAWEAQLLSECEKQLEAFVHVASTASGSSGSSAPVPSSSSTSLWNEPALHSVLFTLGEIVLQHQSFNAKSTLSPRMVQLIQTFLAPSIRRGGKAQAQAKNGGGAAKRESGGGGGAGDLDASFPSLDASGAEDTLNLSIASSSFSAASSLSATLVPLSPSLRAHAFLTLGKCMLRSESLAKKCITLLVGELESPPSAASPLVQNNVLLLLCDLCRTHTSVVDPYVGSITALLGSGNALLRKHTIMVLNVLLQEEYLKMRSSANHAAKGEGNSSAASASASITGGVSVPVLSGGGSTGGGGGNSSSMLYRYLRCLVDEDESIRQLVTVSLPSILGRGTSGATGATGAAAVAAANAGTNIHSTRIHMHFVELIYFLNQCFEHPLYNQFGSQSNVGGNSKSSSGKRLSAGGGASTDDSRFGLIGALGSPNATKRFAIYSHCLSLLSDEQKFVLTAKLHGEVLQPLVEDGFLTKPWHAGLRVADVVQDTLLLLASEQMQLAATHGGAAKKAAGEGGAEALESELHELALAAEEAGESSGLPLAAAPGSRAAASSAATAHAQAAAKAKLLHRLLKKSTLEHCMPVLLELRSVLARTHSPLERWLMHLFAQMHTVYSTEIQELFAGNPLTAKEIAYDLRRWAAQGEEALQLHKRWVKLDFSMPVVPVRAASEEMPSSVPAASAAAANQAVPSATPIKTSSLSALRVGGGMMTPLRAGTGSPRVLQSPLLRRSVSTPAAAAATVAAVFASLSTPGGAAQASLRTPGAFGPGVAGLATPSLLRRAPSTPQASHQQQQPQQQASKRSRASTAAALTPSRLIAERGEESDASTDSDAEGGEGAHDEENKPRVVVRMPALPEDASGKTAGAGVLQSSLSNLRVGGGAPAAPTVWKVSVFDHEAEEQRAAAAAAAAAPVATKGSRKRAGSAAAAVAPAALAPAASIPSTSSWDQLVVGGRKRKQQSSPQQTSPAAAAKEDEPMQAAPARGKRKGATAR